MRFFPLLFLCLVLLLTFGVSNCFSFLTLCRFSSAPLLPQSSRRIAQPQQQKYSGAFDYGILWATFNEDEQEHGDGDHGEDDGESESSSQKRAGGESLQQQQKSQKDDNDESDSSSSIWSRFLSPVIDDPGLPLSDCLVAQVIAPSLQVAYLSLRHAPQPTWLQPIVGADTSGVLFNRLPGSFVAPTLIHGAGLAVCWVFGALAARAYERKSISPVKKTTTRDDDDDKNNDQEYDGDTNSQITLWDYSNVFAAIFRGGAFASGLLILATQVDLFWEFGGRYVQLGESDQVDFRLLVAAVELINDIVFEATTISAWRLYLAYQTERMASANE